jgi:hypothetical protein
LLGNLSFLSHLLTEKSFLHEPVRGWITQLKFAHKGQAYWCTPVIPALRRLRQEDCEFWASLGYITYRKEKKKINQPRLHLQTRPVVGRRL